MADYNSNAPNSPWGGDFSGQLQGMLAPYQQMAQQFQSPYATMRPNSWLAQNHPKIAGILDNAFLTAGMVPTAQGPEGAGGGIARTMQGLIGGQQFRRQQMMQGAMLPYQMMQPQLQAMDVASQIGERVAKAPWERAQTERALAQTDKYYASMDQANRSKFVPGGLKVDDKGNQWQEIFDPVAGTTRLYNPIMQKHADELTPGQQPSFENEKRDARRSTSGGLMGEIIDMRLSKDPATKMRGDQMAGMYTGMMGTIAGSKAGATQGVTEPPKDLKTFIGQERTAAYGQLPKVQNATEYQSTRMTDPAYWKAPQKEYENYIKQVQGTKQQLDVDLSKYEKSAAPAKGVSFSEYKQDPSKWDGVTAPPAPSAPPVASNKPKGW